MFHFCTKLFGLMIRFGMPAGVSERVVPVKNFGLIRETHAMAARLFVTFMENNSVSE